MQKLLVSPNIRSIKKVLNSIVWEDLTVGVPQVDSWNLSLSKFLRRLYFCRVVFGSWVVKFRGKHFPYNPWVHTWVVSPTFNNTHQSGIFVKVDKPTLINHIQPKLTLHMVHSWCCTVYKSKVKSLSCVWLLETPQTVAYQAPPSMGFSRQEYWSGLPFPSPEDLPDPGNQPRSPTL